MIAARPLKARYLLLLGLLGVALYAAGAYVAYHSCPSQPPCTSSPCPPGPPCASYYTPGALALVWIGVGLALVGMFGAVALVHHNRRGTEAEPNLGQCQYRESR